MITKAFTREERLKQEHDAAPAEAFHVLTELAVTLSQLQIFLPQARRSPRAFRRPHAVKRAAR